MYSWMSERIVCLSVCVYVWWWWLLSAVVCHAVRCLSAAGWKHNQSSFLTFTHETRTTTLPPPSLYVVHIHKQLVADLDTDSIVAAPALHAAGPYTFLFLTCSGFARLWSGTHAPLWNFTLVYNSSHKLGDSCQGDSRCLAHLCCVQWRCSSWTEAS